MGLPTRGRCPLLLLVNIFLQGIVTASDGLPKMRQVSFDPLLQHELEENHNSTGTVTVTLSEAEMMAARVKDAGADVQWLINAKTMHPEVAEVEWNGSSEKGCNLMFNSSSMKYAPFNNTSRFYTHDSTFTIQGKFLGKTGVKFRLVRADDWLEDDEHWTSNAEEWRSIAQGSDPTQNIFDVWVKREKNLWSDQLSKAFIGSIAILIPLANLLMGCELDLGVVRETIQRPTAPAIGMITQFFIMPLLAYSIAHFMFVPHGEYSMALGLFVTGCAPGGGASNFWTILLGGNVNLSVTMTFLSTLASFVMMPLWIWLLGKEFLVGFESHSSIKVPYPKIASSLCTLVFPLLIGVAIARYRPTWAVKCRKVMRPFIIFVLIFLVVFGSLSNLYMFRLITMRSLIGGLLLPWCGFMFGCFASLLTRRSPGDVTAIAIETGIQNTGVAILLLKFSFPEPDNDISSLLPVIVACFTPGPLLAGAAVHMTVKWMKKRRMEPMDEEKCPDTTTPPRPLVSSSTHSVPASPKIALDLPTTDCPNTNLMMVDIPPRDPQA